MKSQARPPKHADKIVGARLKRKSPGIPDRGSVGARVGCSDSLHPTRRHYVPAYRFESIDADQASVGVYPLNSI